MQSQAIVVTPAAASQLVITAEPPTSVTAGSGFGLAVAVEDAYGNLETGYGGEVTIGLCPEAQRVPRSAARST